MKDNFGLLIGRYAAVYGEIDLWRRTSEMYIGINSKKVTLADRMRIQENNARIVINSPAFYKLLAKENKLRAEIKRYNEEIKERIREERWLVSKLERTGEIKRRRPRPVVDKYGRKFQSERFRRTEFHNEFRESSGYYE